MPGTPRQPADDLTHAEGRLAELDAERSRLVKRIEALRRAQAAPAPPILVTPASSDGVPVPISQAEKVSLFAELFRGRTDVYPRRWENRTGKSGYSPHCAREWKAGCEKPRVKCGECPVKAFVPVTDRVLVDHLQGTIVAGVYPLVEGDRCHFVAVDFDGPGWQGDVAAFAEAARAAGLPVAVERSRSGNGAHAWFFFAGQVPAVAARQMASYLLTEAMSRRSEIGMKSYDRLFPNQDTVPRGGYGNLIALPLQRAARQAGNSVFVDDAFKPFSDQWAFLSRQRSWGRSLRGRRSLPRRSRRMTSGSSSRHRERGRPSWPRSSSRAGTSARSYWCTGDPSWTSGALSSRPSSTWTRRASASSGVARRSLPAASTSRPSRASCTRAR